MICCCIIVGSADSSCQFQACSRSTRNAWNQSSKILHYCDSVPVTWTAEIQTFQKLPNFNLNFQDASPVLILLLLASSRQDMSASWETSLKLCNLPVKFDSQPESHWVRLNLIFKFNLKLWDHWQERTYFDFLKWFWIMISHKCRLYLWIHNNVSSCQAGFQVNLSQISFVCCNSNFSTWFPKTEGYSNCLSASGQHQPKI